MSAAPWAVSRAGPPTGFDVADARQHLRPAAWPLAVAVMVLALLGPALWNGFPLIFADTGGYLARPFEGTLTMGRSALYGAFLAAGIPFDFWPNVLLQTLMTVWLLLLVLRVQEFTLRPTTALVVGLALAAFTSLPWYAGQLMPDIFVPLSVLAFYLLAFRRPLLGTAETMGVAAIAAISIACHMSILALALSLLLAFAVLCLLPAHWQWPKPALVPPIAALLAGIALSLTSNAAIGGRFAFTPGGSNFLFARLVQDNIVSRYLDEHCPDPTLRLCPLRAQVPATADDWLWWGDSPLHKLGDWEAFEPEANRIILATLRLYPAAQLAAAVEDTLVQFVMLETGEGINPDNNWHAEWMLSVLAPASMPHFRVAAQQRDRFDFTPINSVQVPLALTTILLLPFLAIALRRRRPAVAALALTAFMALAANAAICGIFSNPNARYQSRLAPVAVLAGAVMIINLLRRSPRDRKARP